MVVFALLLAVAKTYVPIYQAMPPRSFFERRVPQLRQIEWIAGTWRCHEYAFATGAVPARDFGYATYTAKFIMRNRLNGQNAWLQMEDATGRDLSFITFDPIARTWVLTGIEWPVSYGVQTGSMKGRQLVLTGDATVFGRHYRLRTTYTKRSDNAYTLLNEEQRPDGTWMRDDEYDFTRIKQH